MLSSTSAALHHVQLDVLDGAGISCSDCEMMSRGLICRHVMAAVKLVILEANFDALLWNEPALAMGAQFAELMKRTKWFLTRGGPLAHEDAGVAPVLE